MSRLVTLLLASSLFVTAVTATYRAEHWKNNSEHWQKIATEAQAQTDDAIVQVRGALDTGKGFQSLNAECVKRNDELVAGLNQATEAMRTVRSRMLASGCFVAAR